jgi:hypothetical protein
MASEPFIKPLFLLALCAGLSIHTAAWSQKKYDPGASDTEIKIGQTMPYSGLLRHTGRSAGPKRLTSRRSTTKAV